MKKGLSILLIAAALFGFYGGAVSLNDVLACKDYWEEEGEKSTADMNRLEDGLNQLKDNEQAYLDGVADYADGLDALAEGEEAYAEGQATLAQGEADYAAAPAKLAAARKQIADGEDALDEGAESLKSLKTAISGVNQLLKGYTKTWKPGYDALKEAREKLYKGTSSKDTKSSLTQLAAFLDSGQEAYLAALEDVAGDDQKQTAKDYKEFVKSTNELAKDLPEIQKSVKEKYEDSTKLLAALNSAVKGDLPNLTFAGTVANQKDNLIAFSALISDDATKQQYVGAINSVSAAYGNLTGAVQSNVQTTIENKIKENVTATMQSEDTQNKIAALMATGMSQADAVATVQQAVTETVTAAVMAQKDTITEQVKQAVDAQAAESLAPAKTGIIGAMTQISSALADVNDKVNGDDSAIKTTLLPGLKQFNEQVTDEKIDALSDGQKTIAKGVGTIAKGVLGNSTLKAGVKKAMGSDAIALLKAYSASPSPAGTKMADFASFEKQMDKTPGIKSMLEKARKFLAQTRSDGQKTYNAGKAKLTAGKKQYAQGLADYKAAPAKLAAGRAQLAEGLEAIMDGRAALAAGREKLDEYEDGEQQVRDGLATLMGTEAQGGLTSILDRRNGDDEFDDANGHLGLDEGLEAVATGREYQSDSGELITQEITKRAVGTAAGLGAGALAVLAAILSFLKKNKGAGISAILAAAAGGFGVAYGTGAGTEFSSIAGSTVGATPWIAAGILAGVALIHAIAHFTAKEA